MECRGFISIDCIAKSAKYNQRIRGLPLESCLCDEAESSNSGYCAITGEISEFGPVARWAVYLRICISHSEISYLTVSGSRF
jgi:hypothetical protein